MCSIIDRNLLKKTYNSKMVYLTAVLALACAATKYYPMLGVIITLIEILILLYVFFVKKDLYEYLTFYLTVTMTCMDNAVLVYGDEGGTLYSFVNMPIIRGYHTLIFACLPLLIVLYRGNFVSFRKKLRTFPALRKAIRCLSIIFIWGIVSFGFSYLIDDNLFRQKLGFYFSIWRKNFLNYATIYVLIIACSFLLVVEDSAINKLKDYLYKSLIGIGIAIVFSYIFGWSGDYAEGTTLLLTQASFYVMFLLLFPYYENKSWLGCVLLAASTILIMLQKASGMAGKWYLVLFGIAAVWIAQTIRFNKKMPRRKVFINGIGVIIGVSGVFAVLNFISNVFNNYRGGLAQKKLIQASLLLKGFGTKEWYEVLPASPKIRIDQFVNIFLEYCYKPYYAFLGKGFSGAIQHYTDTTNWDVVGSTFSEMEITNGLYAFMHEPPFMLFLMAGFFGLYFIIFEIWFGIKNWKNSVWVVIGIVWIGLFMSSGAFISLYFGLIAWVIGKVECKRKNNGKVIN